MPHVTFGEGSPVRKSYEEKRTILKIPAKTDDDKKQIVRQRSRTISYKIPDETRKPKPAEKLCIERKITYKDLDGNVVKIIYEDSCGKVIRTIYPALPPAPPPPKCSPPPPSPPKCSEPPVSEPSNIPSEDVRNCNWTKIVVKNSRGVVWKIVHVDCDGKPMKTEYPECEPPKRRSTETRRYTVKELDDCPSRRVVIQKESRESVPSCSSETTKTTKTTEKDVEIRSSLKSASGSGSNASASTKESDVQSSQKSGRESTTTRRDSANSSGGRKSFESAEEIVKDENGVTKRVTYTDSRGRRRTVVYDD